MGCGASTAAGATSPSAPAATDNNNPPTVTKSNSNGGDEASRTQTTADAPTTMATPAPPAAAAASEKYVVSSSEAEATPPPPPPPAAAAAAAAPPPPSSTTDPAQSSENLGKDAPPAPTAPTTTAAPPPISMGHGASNHIPGEASQDILDAWNKAEATLTRDKQHDVPVAPQRRGWKTVRVFVSSTFADMFAERELLVKHCFPELRSWCETRKLHLVECDLRWGVPKDSTSENTLRTCLSEVDRCREDNGNPFFLNLLSERYGWIPGPSEVPEGVVKQYGWIDGFSVTAMEIMHGAYRDHNPNAIFFIRTPEFVSQLPDSYVPQFVDDQDFRKEHLNELKRRIRARFPEPGRVVDYDPRLDSDWMANPTGKVVMVNMQVLAKSALEFLKKRIDLQYPLDPEPPDRLEADRLAHEAFMSSRSEVVLGRENVFARIRKYMGSTTNLGPLVLVGHPGCGKSAVMAKAAADVEAEMEELAGVERTASTSNNRTSGSFFKLLYHFIGAAPGSTDLVRLLSRLHNLLAPGQTVPTDADSLVRLVPAMMAESTWAKGKPAKQNRIAIFIDALNQIDADDDAQGLRWLPTKISPNLRLVVSTIVDSRCHQVLKERVPPPTFVEVGPLSQEICGEIASELLGKYNKRLDDAQLKALLAKQDSANPLWLATACEETRVFGIFEQIDAKIASMPPTLLALLESVLHRLETENDRHIIVATCCLVECSRHGLLESELLEILAMREAAHLLPDEQALMEGAGTEGQGGGTALKHDDGVDNAKSEEAAGHEAALLKEQLKKDKAHAYRDEEASGEAQKASSKRRVERVRLAASVWAQVPRTLGRLMRPCGSAGEGRLDFFHRTVSKAVRHRHLTRDDKNLEERLFSFWHGMLVEYFESSNDEARKAEELPYHLEKILDGNRLAAVLVEWEIFERLYTEENKVDLFRSWRAAGGYSTAALLYRQAFKDETDNTNGELARKLVMLGHFFIDISQLSDAVEVLQRALELEETRCGKESLEAAKIMLEIAFCHRRLVRSFTRLCSESGAWAQKNYLSASSCEPIFQKFNKDGSLSMEHCKSLMMVAAGAGSMGDHIQNAGQNFAKSADEYFEIAAEKLVQCEKLITSANLGDAMKAEVFLAKGLLEYNRDEYGAAQKFYMQSLNCYTARLGSMHLDVGHAAHRLGRAYESGRNKSAAKMFYEQSHKIFVTLLGEAHKDTIMAAQDIKDVSE